MEQYMTGDWNWCMYWDRTEASEMSVVFLLLEPNIPADFLILSLSNNGKLTIMLIIILVIIILIMIIVMLMIMTFRRRISTRCTSAWRLSWSLLNRG
jgi:hypothetical protein